MFECDARITRVVQEHKYQQLTKKTHVYIIIYIYCYNLLHTYIIICIYYIYIYIYHLFESLLDLHHWDQKIMEAPAPAGLSVCRVHRDAARWPAGCCASPPRNWARRRTLRVDMSAPEKDKPWE